MLDALQSDSPLIVYMDIKSPYAYLAKDPTCALADALGITVDWRPLTLDIPRYLGSARTNESGKVVEQNRTPGQWAAVRYAYRDAKRYARLRGITLYGTQKIWDSSLAGIGMLWARQAGEAAVRRYMDLAFERFWRRELDIESPDVIRRTLLEAEVALEGFDTFLEQDGRATHDMLQSRFYPAGIYGVPTYVTCGEVFFGREHLPAVRWLLTGRNGPAPDIAYENGTEAWV